MSYCTRCGRAIVDEEKGCQYCNAGPVDLKKDSSMQSDEAEKSNGPEEKAVEQQENEVPKKPENSPALTPNDTVKITNPNPNPNGEGAPLPEGPPQKRLSNGAKVALVAVTLLIPAIGYVIGIIVGVVYMNKPDEDCKSFGKALLILSLIMIALSVLCCIGTTVLGIATGDILNQAYYW